jgi:hypothetical protein
MQALILNSANTFSATFLNFDMSENFFNRLSTVSSIGVSAAIPPSRTCHNGRIY